MMIILSLLAYGCNVRGPDECRLLVRRKEGEKSVDRTRTEVSLQVSRGASLFLFA